MRSLQETTWDQFIQEKGTASPPGAHNTWLRENADKLKGTPAALGNDPQLVDEFGRERRKRKDSSDNDAQNEPKIKREDYTILFE